jgi:hypothetical protein
MSSDISAYSAVIATGNTVDYNVCSVLQVKQQLRQQFVLNTQQHIHQKQAAFCCKAYKLLHSVKAIAHCAPQTRSSIWQCKPSSSSWTYPLPTLCSTLPQRSLVSLVSSVQASLLSKSGTAPVLTRCLLNAALLLLSSPIKYSAASARLLLLSVYSMVLNNSRSTICHC